MPTKTHFTKTKYKNIAFLIAGIVFAGFLATLPIFQPFLLVFSSLGFAGAVIAGMLFVSTFTIATGAVLIGVLMPEIDITQLIILTTIGAVVFDALVFLFSKDVLIGEVKPIYNKLSGSHLNKLLHTRTFSWVLPIMGALILASPLPDRWGVSLVGLSKISIVKFVAISLCLNLIGILFFVSLVLLARSVM